MDALEFYIGELEAALNERPVRSEKSDDNLGRLQEHLHRLETTARNLITAWDAEIAPEEQS